MKFPNLKSYVVVQSHPQIMDHIQIIKDCIANDKEGSYTKIISEYRSEISKIVYKSKGSSIDGVRGIISDQYTITKDGEDLIVFKGNVLDLRLTRSLIGKQSSIRISVTPESRVNYKSNTEGLRIIKSINEINEVLSDVSRRIKG